MTETAHQVATAAGTMPSVADLERMYWVMVTTTLADSRAQQEAKAGKLQAAFYPVRGMEAVCAALGAVLEPRDRLVSTYRNLGDVVAKGVPLKSIVAELYGRVDGVSKGKGGPMHLQDDEVGMTATTGVVGSGLPIAAGLGIAAQLDGDGKVVAVTFGDGATSIGAYHEGMNMAALWQLPVLFICQNNRWAEHTPLADYTAAPEFAQRAASYGMTARKVDGFDPIASWRALSEAVQAIRSGGGPVFLEFETYRLTGHTGTADYSYVPKDELARAMTRDPAPNFRTWLIDQGLVAAERLDAIEQEAESAVAEAFAFGAARPQPDVDQLHEDVFADKKLVLDLL
ncbi:thiamine pyrophosphate-dependent dehydrogenase E1 component subunit alpha [Thermocrispum municipale]|uniref:thiamine pyrophosphate-dependent dehydrogenase E1 component subunit alpha n=1 Tax=Thermocrispum municipale TaxID=37926 RepID=UPI000401B35A|nr:thiamine pyrophosphate-dependent dehydrogenase E1 component subunit alpha [Thermocrispum municipale]